MRKKLLATLALLLMAVSGAKAQYYIVSQRVQDTLRHVTNYPDPIVTILTGR